jgi:hypothetical protein
MLEKTEEAIKYGESRETDTIWYTKRGKTQRNMRWTPLWANNHK